MMFVQLFGLGGILRNCVLAKVVELGAVAGEGKWHCVL